jgi:hypothetical protein
MRMEPVRVKAYGLVPLTKRTYLTWQSVGAVVLAVLYLTAGGLPIPAEHQRYWRWFVLLVVVAEVVETSVMLWRYAVAERTAAAGRSSRRPGPVPPPLP